MTPGGSSSRRQPGRPPSNRQMAGGQPTGCSQPQRARLGRRWSRLLLVSPSRRSRPRGRQWMAGAGASRLTLPPAVVTLAGVRRRPRRLLLGSWAAAGRQLWMWRAALQAAAGARRLCHPRAAGARRTASRATSMTRAACRAAGQHFRRAPRAGPQARAGSRQASAPRLARASPAPGLRSSRPHPEPPPPPLSSLPTRLRLAPGSWRRRRRLRGRLRARRRVSRPPTCCCCSRPSRPSQ